MLHQKRWNSSARCIQYAATIIQLTLEVMQDHLLKTETSQYIGAMFKLMESSDVNIRVRRISCVSVLNHPPNIFCLWFSHSLSCSLDQFLSVCVRACSLPGVGSQFHNHDRFQSTRRSRQRHLAPRLCLKVDHCHYLSGSEQVSTITLLFCPELSLAPSSLPVARASI